MGTVLATIIIVIFLKCDLIQGADLDYNWCSYRYYSQALSWAAASSVCEQKGLKLAVMTEQASYNFVTKFIKESVSRIYSDVHTSMWLGLHKDYSGNLRHDDCKIYTAKDFNPTQNLANSCVYLDAGGTTFKAEECNKAMPFLCQREALDLKKCYDEKIAGESKLAPVGGVHKRDTVDDCSAICGPACFGFKFDDAVRECTVMSYTANAVAGRPNPHYTKALLDIEPYNMVATIEAVNLCSSAVAAGELNNAVTTNVDVPDVTSSNTLQSSYGAVVDVSTDIANPLSSDLAGPASNAATTTIDAPVVLSSITYQSSYGIVDATTTDIANLLSSSLAGAASNAATETIDAPVMLSPSTHQSSYGMNVDTTTDIVNFFSSNLDICTTSAFNAQPGSDSTCYCSCEEQNNETLSVQQLKEKVRQLREQLFIDKKDLSSWKRKLVSAEDKRTSAKGIGFIGAGILITVAVALVILDIPTLIAETKKLAKMFTKCRYEKHQSVKGKG